MIKIFLSFFVFSTAFGLTLEHPAEEKAKLKVKELPQILQKNPLQIPVGQKPIYAVTGDLNFDGKEDIVIVSKKEDAYSLLIYLRENVNQGFRNVFEKSGIIESTDSSLSGLGFTGIPEISNNVLKISFEFSGVNGATFYEYKARWDKKDTFRMIGYTYHQIDCAGIEEVKCRSEKIDINFSTRKMIRDKKACELPSNYVVPSLTEISGELDEPKCKSVK